MLNIRNKIEYITINPADIKRTIKEYWERPYTYKCDNLDKLHCFFKKYKLLKLLQKEIDNLNSLVTIKEIELII